MNNRVAKEQSFWQWVCSRPPQKAMVSAALVAAVAKEQAFFALDVFKAAQRLLNNRVAKEQAFCHWIVAMNEGLLDYFLPPSRFMCHLFNTSCLTDACCRRCAPGMWIC